MDYAFWGKPYNPSAPGTYEIQFSAYDFGSGATIASTEITANVVPLPSAAFAGLGLLGVIGAAKGLRRRAVKA